MDAQYQTVDVAPGLWIWRIPHPDWAPPKGGDRVVTSTVASTGGVVAVLDPLAPPAEATEIWARLDAQPPTMAVVTKPDHVRSVCAFADRFRCRAFGPEVYALDDLPTCEIEPVWVTDVLPGGITPLYDGRSRNEWRASAPTLRRQVLRRGSSRPADQGDDERGTRSFRERALTDSATWLLVARSDEPDENLERRSGEGRRGPVRRLLR